MTKTSTVLKIFVCLMLVGTASAAIYTGIYSEAVATFTTGSAPPDGSQVSNYIMYGDDIGANVDIGEVNTSETHTITIRQRNTGEDDYASTVFFEISCDEGLVPDLAYPGAPEQYAQVKDFVTVNYTDHHGVTHDCTQHITWVSGSAIKVVPPMDAFTFVPGYVHHTPLDIQLHPMAYGNYTIKAHVV